MYWKNNFLPGIISDFEKISLPNTVTIYGSCHNTIKFLKISDRNDKDEIFDRWIDGKPVDQEFVTGDGTILASSAKIDDLVHIDEVGADHGQLMNNGPAQWNILKTLGVADNSIQTFPKVIYPNYKKAIVLTVASPVVFSLEDPDGNSHSPIDDLLVLDNPKSGNYKVNLAGSVTGNFTIYFGRINDGDEAWEEVSGHIFEDGIATYEFDVDFDSPNLGADPLKNAIERLEDLLQWLSLKKIDQLLQEIQTGKYKKSFNKDVEERITQDLNTVRQDMEQDMEDR